MYDDISTLKIKFYFFFGIRGKLVANDCNKKVDSLFFFQAALNFGKFIFREREREFISRRARLNLHDHFLCVFT